jgi:hypothetical protein
MSDPKDAYRSSRFTQISATDWRYDILTQAGNKYSVDYRVVNTGFVKETLMNEKKLVYDREYKIGEKLKFTYEDVIQNFGNLSLVLKTS